MSEEHKNHKPYMKLDKFIIIEGNFIEVSEKVNMYLNSDWKLRDKIIFRDYDSRFYQVLERGCYE